MFSAIIVDDEPAILRGMATLLQWEDFGIELAALANNGLQAWDLIRSQKVDILITDIKMPQMNGLELIQCIRDAQLPLKIIITSGFDDFSLVKQAIVLGIENYLLKPIITDELSSTILATVQKLQHEEIVNRQFINDSEILRNNVLQRWLTHSILPEELEQRAAVLNIQLHHQRFLTVIIDSSEPLVYERVSASLQEYPAEAGITGPSHIYPVTMKELSFPPVIIVACDQIDTSVLSRWLQDTLSASSTSRFFAAIGDTVNSYANLHLSYSSAHQRLQFRLIYNRSQVIDRITPSEGDHDINNIDHEQWISFILSGDINSISCKISEELDRLCSKPGILPNQIRAYAIGSFFAILDGLKTTGINVETFLCLEDDQFLQLVQAKSRNELEKWLISVATRAIEAMNDKDEHINPLVKRTLAAIESNYASNLSLKILANQFNANAAYLGQLFIRETGDTFSNYLNSYRLNKAADLLLHSDLDIREISEQIGYPNLGYFSNLFKLKFGVYPTRFRKNRYL